MYPLYHREITREAVGHWFGPKEFSRVLSGNTGQDHLSGQIGHPEYHFDDSQFNRTYAYLTELQDNVAACIQAGKDFNTARVNYGRFTHAVQDFYAHTNYLQLWAEKYNVTPDHWNGQIDPLDESILNNPRLKSGHFYSPLELITFLPVLGKFFVPLFPADSHAVMNNDSPKNSRWFFIAYQAAMLRTRVESTRIFSPLLVSNPGNLFTFLGKTIPDFEGV